MSSGTPYIGSKISLISKAKIRYEGFLYTIDAKDSTVTLAKVISLGTEDRVPDNPVPAREEVFEYIVFRGTDIDDLHVCEAPKPQDPAIVHNGPIQTPHHSQHYHAPNQHQGYSPFAAGMPPFGYTSQFYNQKPQKTPSLPRTPTPELINVPNKDDRSQSKVNRDSHSNRDKRDKDNRNDRYTHDNRNDRYSHDNHNDRYSHDNRNDRYSHDSRNDRYYQDNRNDRYTQDNRNDRYYQDKKNDYRERKNKQDQNDRYAKDDREHKESKDFRYTKDSKEYKQKELIQKENRISHQNNQKDFKKESHLNESNKQEVKKENANNKEKITNGIDEKKGVVHDRQRGSSFRGRRGDFRGGIRNISNTTKFNEDFDFETANAKFHKDEIQKELLRFLQKVKIKDDDVRL